MVAKHQRRPDAVDVLSPRPAYLMAIWYLTSYEKSGPESNGNWYIVPNRTLDIPPW